MTIVISPGYAALMAADNEEDNPLILWRNKAIDAAWDQPQGTTIESASFLSTDSTYDRWIGSANASGNCNPRLLMPEDRSSQMACIAAHNLGDTNFTVSIEYSIDASSSWVDSGAGTTTQGHNDAIIFLFTEAPAADYWRIRLSGGNPDEIATIGVFYIGNPVIVPQRIYQGYAPPIRPTQSVVQANVSEGGNLLGSSVVRKGSSAVANLTHLKSDFVRGTNINRGFSNFQRFFNDGGGFFWAWRPTTFGDAFYGWRGGATAKPINSGPKGYMSVNLEMKLYDNP